MRAVGGFAIALFVLFCAADGFAAGLFTPFSLDSAQVMPKGVRRAGLTGFTTELGEKYNGSGAAIPLGDAFNKSVSWRELTDSMPAGFDRGQFRGGLSAMSIEGDEIAGYARGMVNTRVTANTPVLAYGLTERLTLGMGVPVVYSNVSVSTGWAASPQFESRLQALCQDGYCGKVEENRAKLQNVVETKIANYGYKPLQNEQRTDIGDITLGAKYQLFRNETWAFALAPKVILPTGRVADVDKVVDVSSGDGQWDVGLAAVSDWSPVSRFTLTSSMNYTYQMPSVKSKRIPLVGTESISPDVDPSVTEKLGDTMGAGLGAKFRVQELWTLGVGYSLQYKLADQYSGSVYAAHRYRHLERDTEQVMQAAQAGITFSTVPLFRAQKFAAPLEASVNFARVLGGRNVNLINLTSFDLAAFF